MPRRARERDLLWSVLIFVRSGNTVFWDFPLPAIMSVPPARFKAPEVDDEDLLFKMDDHDKILGFEDTESTGHWVAVRSTDNLDAITYEHHRYNPQTSQLIVSYYRRFVAWIGHGLPSSNDRNRPF